MEQNRSHPFAKFVQYYRDAISDFHWLDEAERTVKNARDLESAYQNLLSAMQPYTTKPAEVKIVTAQVKGRLQLADAALAYAKTQLPFGAGNQLLAALATAGNVSRRMEKAKASARFGLPQGEGETSGSVALAAQATQGATCRECASLVYEFLHQQNVPCQIVVVQGIDHTFVLIGNQGEKASEKVVADPWPTFTQALLQEDHFVACKAKGEENIHPGSVQPGPSSRQLVIPNLQTIAAELVGSDLDDIADIPKKIAYLLTMPKMEFAPFATRTLAPFIYKTSQENLSSWPPLHTNLLIGRRPVNEEVQRLQTLIPPEPTSPSSLPEGAQEGEDQVGKYIAFQGKRYYWYKVHDMGEDPTDEEDAREYKKDIIEKIQKKALDQLESYL